MYPVLFHANTQSNAFDLLNFDKWEKNSSGVALGRPSQLHTVALQTHSVLRIDLERRQADLQAGTNAARPQAQNKSRGKRLESTGMGMRKPK